MMTAVLVVLMAVAIVVFGVAVLFSVVRAEIGEDLRRRRMAAEVARATSALRRVEHDALRRLRDATEPFIDLDGEEQ